MFRFIFKIAHDETTSSTTKLEQTLVEENLFQGSCLLPHIDAASWVSKFTVNVTYDGQQFTEAVSLYIYQSECQQQQSVGSEYKFSLKVDSKQINSV